MKRTKTTKLTAFVAVLALFTLGSCDGFAPTVKVPFTSEAEFDLASATVKTVADDNEVLLTTWTFDQDVNTLISDYGGDPEKIKESNVITVTLTYVGELEVDLTQIVTSLKLMIDKNPAELEELVAQSTEVGTNSISFEVIKGDIFDYTLGDNGFTFLVYGVVDQTNMPQVVDVNITVSAELVVELL